MNSASITQQKCSLASLAGIHATEEEIEYYKLHGFQRAEKRAKIGYMLILAQQIHELEASELIEKYNVVKQLCKKLIRLLVGNTRLLSEYSAAVVHPWPGELYSSVAGN